MDLAKVSPLQIIIICAVLSIVISDDKDADELNVYGNLIVAVGSLVLTAAAQKDLLKTRSEASQANEANQADQANQPISAR